MAREFGSSGCGAGSVPVYEGPADVVFQSNLLGCVSFGSFSGMENMIVYEKDDAYLDIRSIPEDMKFGVLLSGFLKGLDYGSDEYNEAAQTGAEWQTLVRRYNAGEATLEDLKNLTVGLLHEIQQKEDVLQEDDRCTRIAKQKYDTWPSAYASGAVVRCRRGEIWKKKK